MRMSEKYSAVERVQKELLSKFDEKELNEFIEGYIKRELASHLADGIMCEAMKGEIIVSLTDMSQEEDEKSNMVKFRQGVRVDVLVRCKDCRFHENEEPGMVYCPAVVGGWVEDDWFCKGGERRDADADMGGKDNG